MWATIWLHSSVDPQWYLSRYSSCTMVVSYSITIPANLACNACYTSHALTCWTWMSSCSTASKQGGISLDCVVLGRVQCSQLVVSGQCKSTKCRPTVNVSLRFLSEIETWDLLYEIKYVIKTSIKFFINFVKYIEIFIVDEDFGGGGLCNYDY